MTSASSSGKTSRIVSSPLRPHLMMLDPATGTASPETSRSARARTESRRHSRSIRHLSRPNTFPRTISPVIDDKARHPRFTVRPVDGQVFIYFPADNETSGLRFHIHAPFASTVARDSVRDDDGNGELVAGIADLIAHNLPAAREMGLISDGLLAALPNANDELSERYEIVRDRILTAFRDQPIAPMMGGATVFHESTRLVRSVGALRAVLTAEDVNILRSITAGGEAEPGRGWLLERDGRPGAFLDSLEAIDFGANELGRVLVRVGELDEYRIDPEADEDDEDEELDDDDKADLQSWDDWLSGKGDAWLHSFYVALGRLTRTSHNPFGRYDPRYWGWSEPLLEGIEAAPLARVHSQDGVLHVIGSRAYLPTSPGLRADDLLVDGVLAFSQGDTKIEKQDAGALQEVP